MSFFREYLARYDQKVEEQFSERDESWFVFALLQLRVGFRLLQLRVGFRDPMWVAGPELLFMPTDPLRQAVIGPELGHALRFVSAFSCFFYPKPPRYRSQITAFKNFFIPGFTEGPEKLLLLFRSARPKFSTTPLEEAKWVSLDDYFDIDYLIESSGGTPIVPASEPPATPEGQLPTTYA